MRPANTKPINISKKIHKNNFDSLRFLFASFVIITHSFALLGNESGEFISRLTSGQVSLSYIGLNGFFIISGFLIYQSVERSKSIIDYLWKRVLRIFPGLIVVSFVTAFVLGPLITSLNFIDFFSGRQPYFFFIDSINLLARNTQSCLPGVFDKNPVSCEVNGSLWTISYEWILYIGLISLFFFKKRNWKKILLLSGFVFIILIKKIYVTPYIKYEYFILNSAIGLKALCNFGYFFILGSLFAAFKYDKLSEKYHRSILVAGGAIFLFLLLTHLFSYLPAIIVPVILSFGLLKFSFFPFLKRTGDISYGIYIYGFPVQQTLLQYFQINSYVLMICSLLIAFFLGLLSWNFIEKPCLKFKNMFSNNNTLKKLSFISKVKYDKHYHTKL